VDEVEIKNVGGRGVASEATLLQLIDAVKGTGPAGNSSEQRLRDLQTRSTTAATKEQSKFVKGLKAGTGAAKTFAEKLLITGNRLGDFSEMLLGNGRITRFVNFVDKTVDQFRDLSSVGASFNNSLVDMVRTSVDASMSLDDFVGMVRSNSEELARFGGSATQGAKLIGEFSRDVRMGIGQRFFEMGLTMENVNEALIGYMTLETMRGRRNIRSDAESQAGAAEYIMQLDKLAKLTGKQREALMDSQAALQTDGQVRNQLARVEEQLGAAKAEELRSIYTLQKTVLPSFHDSLLDLSDGVAQSDIGRALQNAVPGITQFMQRVGEGSVSQAEYVDYMANNVQPHLQQFARQMPDATLQVLRGMGGVQGAMASLVDNGHELSAIMNMNTAEAEAEQRRTDRVTGTLGKFEQALVAFRSFLFNTFIDSAFVTELGNIGNDIMDAFGSGSTGAFSTMKTTITNTMRYLFGTTGVFTNGLRWASDFFNSPTFQTSLTKVADGFRAVGKWGKEFIDNVGEVGLWNALLEEVVDFGSMMSGAFTRLFENVELRNSISTAFENVSTYIIEKITDLWESSAVQGMLDSMRLFLEDQIINLFDTLNNGFGGLFINDRALEQSREDQSVRREFGGEENQESLRTELSRMQAEVARLSGPENTNIVGGYRDPQALWDAQNRLNVLESLLQYNTGTDGFEQFGAGTPVMLHGSEAVVPRDSPAGEMLSNFFDNQNNINGFQNGSRPTPAVMSNTATPTPDIEEILERLAAQQTKIISSDSGNTQTQVVDKLNEVNSSIMRLLAATQQGVNVQEKTRKSMRGLGTDMFKGAGL
jgi:hypothetical protein